MTQKVHNGIIRDMTAEEQADYDSRISTELAKVPEQKLEKIRNIRTTKLQETDYLSNSDVTMPSNIKTWRQTLRDIPANHTNEAAYDLLLANDGKGNLTHSIWTKP